MSTGHVVTTEPNSAHVRVRTADGETLIAETHLGHVLHETNIQDRWYLPKDAVTVPLAPTATTSHCPYKGDASYWSVVLPDGAVLEDAAWSYEDPKDAAADARGEVSFWGSSVLVEVDGERVRV